MVLNKRSVFLLSLAALFLVVVAPNAAAACHVPEYTCLDVLDDDLLPIPLPALLALSILVPLVALGLRTRTG